MTAALSAKRREDYQASAFQIDSVDLCFELNPEATTVTSVLAIRRGDTAADKLVLDGKSLDFQYLLIDGKQAIEGQDFELNEDGLSINITQAHTRLEIKNTINPEANSSLEGLYYVSGAYCTQCEAEGFRKITYFLDRPDVLSVYTVSIISDDNGLSALLSNGNKISDERLEDGRRKVVWHDPHYKPCYLFALVAGDFDCLKDSFLTSEGRQVDLELYVDRGRLHQADFAMASLKKAMRWDEQRFGLAYDLDIYMIVAVDFFNMGAMENKGLNVFNSKFVLAEPSTATDEDYFNIESIIAHEYFHNWTGNRVTCRDWFQLSLKEGLTVFRDQQFSEDMGSQLACRIKQVKVMREHQFAEDAGPMSHPIRPDEVMEMNNFYTVTVYDKGAEVIRMLHTMLGKAGFKQGLDLYFERHDGQAVTCDDFVQAMQDANQRDLTHFKAWYSQSGTPVVKVRRSSSDFILEQINLPSADQARKQALSIPVNISLLDAKGVEHYFDEADGQTVLLEQDSLQLAWPKVCAENEQIVPVLLSDFSAPVKIDYKYSIEEMLHILRYASSHYAKWDASQMLYSKLVNELYQTAQTTNEAFENAQEDASLSTSLKVLADYVNDCDLPLDVVTQILTPPSFETLAVNFDELNPQRLNKALEKVTVELAQQTQSYCQRLIDDESLARDSTQPYAYVPEQVNKRGLYGQCVKLLVISAKHAGQESSDKTSEYLESAFINADNMTDKLNLIRAAQQGDLQLFDKLMLNFEQEYQKDTVVMDKWFALHASTPREDILARLDLLQAHSQFSIKNPNKVRSLLGSFAFYNTEGFHAPDGSGYRYLADYLIQLDAINPQVASRLVTPLLSLKRYSASARESMLSQLQRLFTQKSLSKDLFEKLAKTLSSLEQH